MRNNFRDMPRLLKLIVLCAIPMMLFAVGALNPSMQIDVFGRRVSSGEWMQSGVGVLALLVGFLMGLSALLLLRRSPIGRHLCAASWIATALSIPLAAVNLSNTSIRAHMLAVICNALLAIAIIIYLYASASVRRYLRVSSA
jgi:hypothetical protein